ncbi:MAG: DUF2442 domain-containing protein [Nitrospinae bacterium]|nr:DUF2442 domain-containing protein [Nitrospinota bacterium]
MLKDVVSVKPLNDHRLFVRFEDGAEGEIDVSALVSFSGVFAPLSEKTGFDKVRVNSELGSIEWECGADLDPDVVYSVITGQPIPDYRSKAKAG